MAKTSPAQFLREVRQEMRKITWPTRKETLLTTLMVFIMVVIMALFFFGIDQVLSLVIKMILGIR